MSLPVTAIGARAWVFLTKSDEERSWSANSGYDDSVGRYYSYDSNVGRSQQVKQGDLVVIRVDDYVAGWSFIDEIEVTPDSPKVISRCPECKRTNHYPRMTKHPRNKCSNCGREFEDSEKIVSVEKVTAYRAYYERMWIEAARPVSYQELQVAAESRDTFNAIRPLNRERLPQILERVSGRNPGLKPDLTVGHAEIILGGHQPGITRRRIGQRKFRFALMERFGENCAFSGAQPPHVLEAAHLYNFAERPTHQHDGGLLLRRDFHALFDARLLTVNPTSWQIEVAPQLSRFHTYQDLAGSELQVPHQKRPSRSLVAEHYESCQMVFAAG